MSLIRSESSAKFCSATPPARALFANRKWCFYFTPRRKLGGRSRELFSEIFFSLPSTESDKNEASFDQTKNLSLCVKSFRS